MRLSVGPGSVCTMHRHVAGALTGRVTKWVVLGVWILAFVGLGGFAGKLTEVQNNEASSWLPATAESTRGFEKLEPFQDPNSIPTVVVYERKGGLTQADLAAAADDAKALAKLDGVDGPVAGPFPSKDGEALQTIVNFNLGADGWNKMPDVVDEIRDITESDGLTIHVAGAGGQAADAVEAFGGLDSTLLFAALGVVILILLVVYRSPTLWILPIVSAVFSLTVSMGLVYFLAKADLITVNGQSQAILSILCIGAGTDYALLLVARYREELRKYSDRHEAMAHALHRAAPAILASAATVILGMLCLTVAEMSSTAGMGPVVAVGVAVTYLVMVTLLPALLVITGRWMFWPLRPKAGSAEPTQTGTWAKVGKAIAVRPRSVWVVTTGLLLIACLGLFKLDANGLSTEDTYTKEFDSLKGTKVLAAHEMVDQSNTMLVVADAAKLAEVGDALETVDGVADQQLPDGSTAKVVPLGQPKDGIGALSVVLDADVSSQAAFDIVEDARKAVHAVKGADALVTGGSAIYLDTKVASQRDNKVIIPLVLAVVLLVLIALLRALTAPLILLGTVILSFGAALGISTLLFEYVFGFAGADASFPLFAFVFLVALGIDYNIFLMTRVREESVVHGTRKGALIGLTSTGGVITSAGIVLAATFIVLGTLPLVFLAEMGVAVALGVMLDTMIVRSILVTAINLDLGEKIWWPSKVGAEKADPDGASELVDA